MIKTFPKHIYFIGIKGVGMTALAQLLKKQGHQVSGSDTAETFLTDAVLQKERIPVCSGFSPKNIPADAGLIIYSQAYSAHNNAEMRAADRGRIPLMSLTQATAHIFNAHTKGIAVCGTHGKSTTTALLSFVLERAGLHPSAIIGSHVPQLGGNALSGKGDIMVLEADEYKNKLASYEPYGVVLNNIEYDHPDYFKNFSAYKKAFADFIKKIPANGFVVANVDDSRVAEIVKKCQCKVITYGSHGADIGYLVSDIKQGCQNFSVQIKNKNLGEFKIKLIGAHNVRNAVAVIAVGLELKVPILKIKRALAAFKGLARRMEVLGTYQDALFIDDYAHHPTEIQATLTAARLTYPEKKITCVFMPHTFSRTAALFDDFAHSFSSCDEVILLPVYASAREQKGDITSRDLLMAIKKTKNNARYLPSLIRCADYLQKKIDKNDVILLMGAGDTFRVWDHLKKG